MFFENVNCSIHKSGKSDSEIKGSYRFLKNEKVTESLLIDSLSEQCAENVVSKRVMALCDTCTINIDNHKNRIQDFTGLGRIAKNQHGQSIGFLVHPILIYDAQSGSPLGVSEVKLISRSTKAARAKSRRWETKSLAIEDKESYKWLEPCISSMKGSLKEAEHVTFVMDREGDIMEVYDRLKSEKSDLLVRAMHNRNVLDEQGRAHKLYDLVRKSKVQGKIKLKIDSSKRKKRMAHLDIRYAPCKLQWHKRQKVNAKVNKEGVSVSIIEVRERRHKGYSQEAPLIWRLITTQPITTLNQAIEQIKNYTRRWKIEEYFKLLKTDGYNIESTELTSGGAIRKLLLILMKTSIKILQLKEASRNKGDLKLEKVFTNKEVKCLEYLNEQYSGTTEKQRNPHPRETLPWAAWVIARLGGWKEFYTKNRPPGNKTFVWGLEKFDSIMIGYNLLNQKDVG